MLYIIGGIHLEKGRITKLIGGLYTVRDEHNDSHKLKARGKFRHTNESPKVGDHVMFDSDFIMEVLPRKNNLLRPAVCNVDQAILINSAKDPHFSFNLLDRFLLLIEHESITPITVITKIDLIDKNTLMVSTDFGDGMTISGYPKQVKIWKRGTELKEAKLVFEGKEEDMGIWGFGSCG